MAKIQTNIRTFLSKIDLREGLLSNIVSTMIGIILTIGVGALYQHHKDRQLAREMMFNVIMAGDINRNMVVERDSAFNWQAQCIDSLVTLYNRYDGDLGKAPKDSVQKYINVVMNYKSLFNHQDPEVYMNNAETLHQFGNAGIYSDFEDFIQFDKITFIGINELTSQCKSNMTTLYSEIRVSKDKPTKIIERAIENHMLPDFEFSVQLSLLPEKIKMYDFYKKHLLKIIDATEEDYQEFVKENTTEQENVSLNRTIQSN